MSISWQFVLFMEMTWTNIICTRNLHYLERFLMGLIRIGLTYHMSLIDCLSWHNYRKICSQKSDFCSKSFWLLLLRLLLVNAPAQLWDNWNFHIRSTVTQSRMNHCMMLNTCKEALGELSLIEIANEFWRKNEARLNTFGKFSQDTPQYFVMKMSVATEAFLFLAVSLTKNNN